MTTALHPTSPTPSPAPRPPIPGRGLGIAGFILSMLGAFSPVGLILSIVSLVQGRTVARTNGLAVAGIVLGAIGTILLVVVAIAAFSALSTQTELCSIPDLIRLSCTPQD